MRIFHRAGVPVIGIASDLEHFACQTNMCEQILQADVKSENFIALLERLGPGLAQKAVLVPCTDMSMYLISRHRARLQAWYHIGLPAHETVEMLLDKISFYTYAAQSGLPIPETFFLRSRADVEQAAAKLTYPCILKPPMRSPLWEKNSKMKVYKVESAADLLARYDTCAGWAEVLMVQQWIEGEDDALYSCNCYFNNQNEPLVTFIARKLRQWPPEVGTSCLGEEVRNDEVLTASLDLFRGVNYHGLGYVEMKRDTRSGKHYIIEPNIGRPTGRSAIAEFAGIALLMTMYCDLTGQPLPKNRVQQYKGTKWIYLRRDLQSALYYMRRGKLSMAGWLRSLWGVRQDAVFAWSDLKPFLADFSGKTALLFGRKPARKTPAAAAPDTQPKPAQK